MVSRPPMSCTFMHKYNSSHFRGHNLLMPGCSTEIALSGAELVLTSLGGDLSTILLRGFST